MSASERVPMGTKLAFGVGASAEAAVHIGFNTFNFLFYNNVLGLSGSLCGLAVTIALLFDAVSDPLVGSISDRWRSSLGRRHPFLYAAPIPIALCFLAIYLPPAGLGEWGLFAWFTVATVLMRLSLTLYQVPHLALGAELSEDYHERTVVMSYNTLFAVFGGAGVYFFGWSWFGAVEGGANVRAGYPAMALGISVFAAVVIFLSAHGTRSQISKLARRHAVLGLEQTLSSGSAQRSGRGLWDEIRGCLANRNYRMLLLGLVFVSVIVGVFETLGSYMNLFFWELPENQIRLFGLASPPGYILAFVITARLHRRFDKREAIMGSAMLVSVGIAAPVLGRLLGLLPSNGSPALLPMLMLAVMTCYLGIAVLQISVMSALADVADEHALQTGKRQEGIFFAARTFFAKLTSGLGHVVAGVAIDAIAFPKQAKPGEVAPEIVNKLGWIAGPSLLLPAILAVYFYTRYGLDKQRHSEIRQALAAGTEKQSSRAA